MGIQEKPAGYEIVSQINSMALVQNVFTACFYRQWGKTRRSSFRQQETQRRPSHNPEILLAIPRSQNNALSQLRIALVRKLKPANHASSSQLPKKV